MMKDFKLYILSLISILTFSCTDLVETPVGLLSPEGYFQTEGDVQSCINGCYGSMASSNYYGAGLTVPLQIMSDMVDLGFNYSNYADFNNFTETPTNTYVSSIWKCSYGIIAIANTAIAAVDQINEEQEVKDALEGEARFIRAFVYYHLVRLYGAIPYLEDLDYVVDDVKQSSVDDIYAGIISDLKFAKEHLSEAYPEGDVRTRPSQGAAATVLASVYLTRENWEGAYEQAKWVIDNAGSLGYALEADYQDLFRAETQDYSKEYIFHVDFTANQTGDNEVNSFTYENDSKIGPFNAVDGGIKPYRGWSMLVPSLAVYDTWDVDDYRRKVGLTDSIKMDSETGPVSPYTDWDIARPHIAKWERFGGEVKSSTAGWRCDLNYICFRYAEVLLIAAEAGNEIGNTDEGVGYVNQLRARARSGGVVDWSGANYGSYGSSNSPADVPTGISQDDFRNLVLEERRIELSFEFKRWYDIVRRDLGNEVFGENGLEPQPNFDSEHYLLPLPQTEMDLSPNLVQNPGY